jgi:hypothetical protein
VTIVITVPPIPFAAIIAAAGAIIVIVIVIAAAIVAAETTAWLSRQPAEAAQSQEKSYNKA